MTKLKPIDPRADFPKMEEEVLKFWEDNQVFQKSLEQTRDGEPFVFFEGPPTANAKPAIHHVEARAFKDLIPRFQTMRGRFVLRKAGWDTHGLPVELQIEKALGISGKKQIESIKPTVRESIIEFNRLCRESVWQYKEDWEKLTARMGYWLDMDNPYITYQNTYIESVWWILKQVWDKGLVYLGHKVVPYCPRCGTALSSHEVAQGYKTVKDNSVYIKFRLKSRPNTYILSWTTTPWTLPGNVALAVGNDIDYAEVPNQGENKDEIWILARERLNVLGQGIKAAEKNIKGSDLVGLEYEPLFDVPQLRSENSHKIYPADFVTTTDGTGVVHTAVMYGEEDYELGEKLGLPKFHTVDETGRFIASVPDLAGMYVKDEKTEQNIFDHLNRHGQMLRVEEHEHEYPHCWRCGTPLLYYARDSWFIRMSSLRQKLMENNQRVNWVPDYIKNGRFGEWLSEVKDWAISRERYWGTPIPIWQCTACGDYQMAGSVKDLGLTSNTFYFSRHGQAENNVLGLNNCWPETKKYELTELGKTQAQAAAEELSDKHIDVIFSSDITRDRMTAEIIAEQLGIPVVFDSRLREVDVGTYNGKTYDELLRDYPFEKRWKEAPGGGETNSHVQERMVAFVEDVNSKYQNKNILVVSHGDPLWLLMMHFGADTHYPDYAKPFEMNVGIRDLHRPYIDDVVLKCKKCGSDAQRVPAVLDVWFDSGSMPYAQWHYPFENKEMLDGASPQFPADYISEAIDQTRGWFYTLLAISTLLNRGEPYKNVINLGHLLDEKGQKMSKSKGNVVDPWSIIDKHGVDGLRFYMYSVNQPGDSKLFATRDVELVIRKNFLTLWNILSFLTTYANHEGWDPQADSDSEKSALDFWVEAKTRELVNNVTAWLENYDIFHSSRAFEEYINEFSTWYVRRSRDRKGPVVYRTIYESLKTLSRLMAPFVPFLAENIWQALRQDHEPVSVHLTSWPQTSEMTEGEKTLLAQMEEARQIVEAGHSTRKSAGIKLRQPLASVKYSGKSRLPENLEEILVDELNVKKVGFAEGDFKVEFDTVLSVDLKREGLARELERTVQEMRKSAGLKVGELVNLTYDTDDGELIAAFELFDTKKTYVNQVIRESDGEEREIDGKKARLGLKRA